MEPVDAREGEAGFQPLGPLLMAAVIVGRLDSIAGQDSASQFFQRLARRPFGQQEYRWFIQPKTGEESVYREISIKNIARIAVDRIVEGARLALQAVGQAA